MFFDADQPAESSALLPGSAEPVSASTESVSSAAAVAALRGEPTPGRMSKAADGTNYHDEYEWGPMCADRAAHGYNSGMGKPARVAKGGLGPCGGSSGLVAGADGARAGRAVCSCGCGFTAVPSRLQARSSARWPRSRPWCCAATRRSTSCRRLPRRATRAQHQRRQACDVFGARSRASLAVCRILCARTAFHMHAEAYGRQHVYVWWVGTRGSVVSLPGNVQRAYCRQRVYCGQSRDA